MTIPAQVRPLLTPALLIGGYALVVTLLKDLQAMWPLQPGLANWRFGAAGFLLGSGAIPVLGLALMVVAAALTGSRALTRAVGGFGVGLGVFLAALLVMFYVDSRVVSEAAAGGSSASLVAGAIRRTLALGVATVPAYLVLGVAGLRAARALETGESGAATGLVVGEGAR